MRFKDINFCKFMNHNKILFWILFGYKFLISSFSPQQEAFTLECLHKLFFFPLSLLLCISVSSILNKLWINYFFQSFTLKSICYAVPFFKRHFRDIFLLCCYTFIVLNKSIRISFVGFHVKLPAWLHLKGKKNSSRGRNVL